MSTADVRQLVEYLAALISLRWPDRVNDPVPLDPFLPLRLMQPLADANVMYIGEFDDVVIVEVAQVSANNVIVFDVVYDFSVDGLRQMVFATLFIEILGSKCECFVSTREEPLVLWPVKQAEVLTPAARHRGALAQCKNDELYVRGHRNFEVADPTGGSDGGGLVFWGAPAAKVLRLPKAPRH